MNQGKIFNFRVLALAIALLLTFSCTRTEEAATDIQMTDLEKFDQLTDVFNKGEGKVRLLIPLSPTWPGCRRGYSDIQKLLKNVKDDRLEVYIVWLPKLPADNRSWAVKRTSEFSDDRVTYFWDGDRITDNIWNEALELEVSAFDIYGLYGADSKWDKKPTSPDFWMHTLHVLEKGEDWDVGKFEKEAKKLLTKLEQDQE